MSDQKQTPLYDLLRSVPQDGRHIYEHSPIESHSIPYGRLCHEAADEIESLRAKVAELTDMFEEAKTSWEEANEGWFQADKWKKAAETLGESLADVGPSGYYDFTPEQWLIWAQKQLEAKHEAVEPVAMRGDFDGYGYMFIDNGSGSDWERRHPDWEFLYVTPPSTQAAVSAALRKAAEVLREMHYTSEAPEAILALPHDDSHLREICLRVARNAWNLAVLPNSEPNELKEIVDRVFGEAK